MNHKRILFVVVWEFFFFNLFAQGSGVDGELVVSNANTVVNLIQSQLTASASVGQATVVVESANGFAENQVCLLIQMRGAGAGNYEEKVISSITGDTITFSSSLTHAYTDDGTNANDNNMAQLVHLPQYTNVTVNSGASITCNAWNGISGGIVAFLANGTVTINGSGNSNSGAIYATAKGGIGGSHGPGGVANNGGTAGMGGNCTNGNGCSDHGAGCNGEVGGNAGACGGFPGAGQLGQDGAGNGGDGGVNSCDAISNEGNGGQAMVYSTSGGFISQGTGGSNYSNIALWGTDGKGQGLLMGGGGAGGKGGAPGLSGGGGGGSGGTFISPGTSGSAGSTAHGGNGGAGGAGGGIIYIRCNALAGSGTVFSSGGDGVNGAHGYSACGGNGASQNVTAGCGIGGGGGDGLSGKNGSGGSGGSGGGPGAIYIYASSTNSHTGTKETYIGIGGNPGLQGAAGPSAGVICSDAYFPTAGTFGAFGGYGNYVSVVGPNITTGINNFVASQSLGVQPNPAINFIQISFNSHSSQNAMVKLFDASGKLVLEKRVSINLGNNKVELSIDNLPIGVYVTEIAINEKILSAKFVKK